MYTLEAAPDSKNPVHHVAATESKPTMSATEAKIMGNPVLDWLLAHCHVRSYPKHHLIIQGGTRPETLYLMVEGSVAVLIEDANGNEIVLSYLNRGDFFGEMGLFCGDTPRSAWVRTRTPCRVAEIAYNRFRKLAMEHADVLFELASQMAARLRRTNRKVEDLAFLDVAGRIARALLDLCEQPDAMTHPDGMQLRISRQELARIVGCSREMAGRVLKSLEEQSLISVSGKTIVVLGTR